jgi:hypothetical protein
MYTGCGIRLLSLFTKSEQPLLWERSTHSGPSRYNRSAGVLTWFAIPAHSLHVSHLEQQVSYQLRQILFSSTSVLSSEVLEQNGGQSTRLGRTEREISLVAESVSLELRVPIIPTGVVVDVDVNLLLDELR